MTDMITPLPSNSQQISTPPQGKPVEVTKDEPCRHCGKPNWCYRLSNTVLEVCNRLELWVNGQPANGYYQTSKTDKDGKPYLAPIEQKKQPRPKQRRQWDYEDRDGNLIVRVERVDDGKGSRKFYQKRYENGKYVTGLEGVNREDIPIYNYRTTQLAVGMGLPVILAEGESNADDLMRLGINATTNIGGSHGWKDSDTQDLEGVKNLIISMDMDVPGVKRVLHLLKVFPQTKLIIPYPEMLEQGNLPKEGGLDIGDKIKECKLSKDDVLKMAMEITPDVLARLERQINKVFADATTVDEEGESKGKRKLKKPVQLGQLLFDDFRNEYKFHHEQQTWRKYNGRIWERVFPDVFTSIVYNNLEPRQEIQLEQPSQWKGAEEVLRHKLIQLEWVTLNRKKYIPFSDCVLDLETMMAESYKPGFGFLSSLPYPYQPVEIKTTLIDALAEYCPSIYSFMNTAMGGDEDKIKVLLAIVNGVIKQRFSELHKFIYLIGKPGSGKSTFARLLNKIIGEVNNVSGKLAHLSKETFIASMIDKLLVTFPDERKRTGVDDLLSLTGGDRITYRELYKNFASSYFFGTILIISNTPIFVGDTTGIDRRQLLVDFNNPVPKELRNSKLEESFDAEIPALVSIALQIIDEEVEAIIKGTGDTEIPSFKLHEWLGKVRNNSLAAFVDERIVRTEGATYKTRIGDGRKDPEGHFNMSSLYGNYLDFCKVSGMEAQKVQTFSEDFLALVVDILGYKAEKDRQKYGWCIKGEIRLRNHDGEGNDQDADILPISCILELAAMASNQKNEKIEEKNAFRSTPSTQPLPHKDLRYTPESTPNLHQVYTNDEVGIDFSGDVPEKTEGCTPECIPGVDQGVDLKPLLDKESVYCVDQNAIFTQNSSSSTENLPAPTAERVNASSTPDYVDFSSPATERSTSLFPYQVGDKVTYKGKPGYVVTTVDEENRTVWVKKASPRKGELNPPIDLNFNSFLKVVKRE